MWTKVFLFFTVLHGGVCTLDGILKEDRSSSISALVGDSYSCGCSITYSVSKEVCYVCCCNETNQTGNMSLAASVCDNVHISIPQTEATWVLEDVQTLGHVCENQEKPDFNISDPSYYPVGSIGCNISYIQPDQCQTACNVTQDFSCTNKIFGSGPLHFRAVGPCNNMEAMTNTAASGHIEDQCIIKAVEDLLSQSQALNSSTLPQFLEKLQNVTSSETEKIMDSPADINAIVKILNNIANTSSMYSIPISKTSMQNFLVAAGLLTSDQAKQSWNILNNKSSSSNLETTSNGDVKSASSSLLNAFEIISAHLVDESFSIQTPYVLLNKTTFTKDFSGNFNSSVTIDISNAEVTNISITVIIFASMDNVLPARDDANSSFSVINGKVTLIRLEKNIKNISLTFKITNTTLTNPKCVFWDFKLFDGLGGWSGKGCLFLFKTNETVTCNCNHTTSFSILMSPESPDDPLLNSITYIGLGISMASLVICLFTEAVLWKKIKKNATIYLRHISIVNTAVSLLVADIWFFIGATMPDATKKIPLLKIPACIIATFCIHVFYLALFFWMFASALLLLYRSVKVFHGGMSERSMMAIGFFLGYGGPLIIASITIAVTAPSDKYIQGLDVCWLNWNESKALLAFFIPALLIVFINLTIVIVVINKLLTRKVGGDASQEGERPILMVIARTLAILTPFFGLTWILGVGTILFPKSREMHIAFACANSVQGVFIWVFGTLMDKKVQSEMATSLATSVQKDG